MDKNRLLALLNKHQENACSKEELAELEQWYSSLNTGNPSVEATDAFANEMLLQFRSRLVTQTPAIPFYRRKVFRIAAAAAVIVLIGTAALVAVFTNKKEQPIAHSQPPIDISAPTGTKAYITLSDGRRIYLDSLSNGSLATDGNVNVVKLADGRIAYNAATGTEVKMNTMTVPKGSKPVKLLLADGSEMWLDAATTVTYPNAFISKERKVEIITGQAYFEIAHNPSMPFIATKGNAEVQVLGTHFNISAFENEDLKVTLLEGSVKVSNSGQTVTIKPGEQARLKSDLKPQTSNNIDLDEVMAWKNGNFQFEGADINAVMKQLARWYDVDVEIKGNINAHFGGTVSREVNVSKVFEMLKLTGEVNYKIDGRKIIVTP